MFREHSLSFPHMSTILREDLGMTRSKFHKRTALGTVLAFAVASMASFVAAAPAQATCTGAYYATNTAAKVTVKLPMNCSDGNQVRARKNWYYTDATNSPVGASYGLWIDTVGQQSIVFLPSGRFYKSNQIESR